MRRRECACRPSDTFRSVSCSRPATRGGTMRIRIATALRIGGSCLVGSLVAVPGQSRAQTMVRRGGVASSGKTISEVALGIVELHQATRSDEQGHFVLPSVPKGEVNISVRRIGYE